MDDEESLSSFSKQNLKLIVFTYSFHGCHHRKNCFVRFRHFFPLASSIRIPIHEFFHQQALQEISLEERKRTLENSRQELVGIEKRLEQLTQDFGAMDKKVQEAQKRVSSHSEVLGENNRIYIVN